MTFDTRPLYPHVLMSLQRSDHEHWRFVDFGFFGHLISKAGTYLTQDGFGEYLHVRWPRTEEALFKECIQRSQNFQ